MPNAAGQTVFEDAVALLQGKPNPFELAGKMDVLTAGLADLGARLANLEHASLRTAHAVSALDARVASGEEVARVLASDRDAQKKRLDAVETAPVAEAKRIDDLQKRVSAVEGAVGSAGFKAAKAEPDDKSSTKK